MIGRLCYLDPRDRDGSFPDVSTALAEPSGLLAAGGRLTPAWLLTAYRKGIFPWYSAGQPILWWSPDPRMVLFPPRLKVSRSLDKTLRRGPYTVTLDRAFDAVIRECGAARGEHGTWITPEMMRAYRRLFVLGHAHSAEAWRDGELAGGLYGIALGRVFFGESMFYRHRDASKVAFVTLVRQLQGWGCQVIDCQIQSSHLASLGAEEIPRRTFTELLDRWCDGPASWGTPGADA